MPAVDSDLHNHFLMIDNEKREFVKEHIWYEVRIMLIGYEGNVGANWKSIFFFYYYFLMLSIKM